MALTDDEAGRIVRAGYEAFNRRDVDAALAVMTQDVRWANGWEGGHVVGHEAVRDYWSRQWREIDPAVTPRRLSRNEQGAVVVEVDQQIRSTTGELLRSGSVTHVFTLAGGLIAQMDIVGP